MGKVNTADYSLASRLRSGEVMRAIWSSMPDIGVVSALAATEFPAMVLDMQHGAHSVETVYAGVEALVNRNCGAIVRIPVGRFDMASRALDFGADVVIAPMINTIEDARAFANAMKFPPVGERSWGPTRAATIRGIPSGMPIFTTANANTISLAMIETKEAYAILDDILALDGIDGVFVGPADFSIALDDGNSVNPSSPVMMKAAADIAARTRKAGKIAAMLAIGPEVVPEIEAMGYQLISTTFDYAILAEGAAAAYARSFKSK